MSSLNLWKAGMKTPSGKDKKRLWWLTRYSRAWLASRASLRLSIWAKLKSFWAQKHGCSDTLEPQNCDPSYPDVCIPSPPPDLDCGEITHQNFEVLQPDPHRFDGDYDGIGCES